MDDTLRKQSRDGTSSRVLMVEMSSVCCPGEGRIKGCSCALKLLVRNSPLAKMQIESMRVFFDRGGCY